MTESTNPRGSSLPPSAVITREDAWLAEVERRWHAIESSAEPTIDHEEALAFVFAAPLPASDRPLPVR